MPTLGRRDLVASTLIAVLVVLYLLFLAPSNFITARRRHSHNTRVVLRPARRTPHLHISNISGGTR